MGLFSSIFGGSESKQSPSTVWGGQAPFLQGLYQRAWQQSLGGPGMGTQPGMGVPPNVRPNAPQLPGRWGQMGGGGRPAAGGGGGLAMPTGPDPLQGLGQQLLGSGLGMAGQLQMLGQAGNPFALGQIGQLGQGLGRFFNQQIAPGIGSQFAASGTYGGDRQALALGQAAEGLGQSFTTGALDILGNSANLALGANQAGLGSLGGLFGLGNAALFGSLPGLQSLLGGPTVLGGGATANQTPGILGTLAGFVPK